eukprot:8969428-Ditylum_brightwellii.AAC.1
MENMTKQKEELDAMKSNIADILSLLQDTTIRNNANHQCSGYGGRGNRSGRNNNRYQPRPHNIMTPTVHYCRTHGVTGGDYHTSRNCENRGVGHKDNATALNRIGGSTQGLE